MGLVDQIFKRLVPPDLPYFEMLDLVHQRLLPRSYLEIGVSTGRSFTLGLPGTRCIGVDPHPNLLFAPRRGNLIFEETSDDFFEGHDLGQLLNGVPLDLAFIDGMHLFEFALRDFINLERASHVDSTILIHDCLPVDEATAERERATDLWSGDVWRLIVLLRRWRPDLDVNVVDWGPSGVGVVRGLDPRSSVLADEYDHIVEQMLAMPYAALDDGTMREQLHVVPGTWEAVGPLLPNHAFRDSNLEMLKARRALAAVPSAVRLAAGRITRGRSTETTGSSPARAPRP